MDYRKYFCECVGISNIRKGNHVHHIDCNRENNDISNLISIPSELHRDIHKHLNRVNENIRKMKAFFNKADDPVLYGNFYSLEATVCELNMSISDYKESYILMSKYIERRDRLIREKNERIINEI